jgi:hypothetical protein
LRVIVHVGRDVGHLLDQIEIVTQYGRDRKRDLACKVLEARLLLGLKRGSVLIKQTSALNDALDARNEQTVVVAELLLAPSDEGRVVHVLEVQARDLGDAFNGFDARVRRLNEIVDYQLDDFCVEYVRKRNPEEEGLKGLQTRLHQVGRK